MTGDELGSGRELRSLLGSPALELEPPPGLVQGVQRGARRVRRRRAVGTAALSLLALAGAVSLGPGLLDGDRGPQGQVATLPPDSRFPDATTPVAVLERFNGGEVVTWFEGRRWCTAAVRTGTNDACGGLVGEGPVGAFALLRGPGDMSLRIDADSLVAGVLGTGVASVVLSLSDDSAVAVSSAQPTGFPRPVWWHRLPPGVRVEAYEAYDDEGEVVASRDAG